MIVARYTSNVSGYVPTFNDGYVYSVNEQLNNGVYTVEIESDNDFSSVMFGSTGDDPVTSLLSVEYLKITNKASDLKECFRKCDNVTSINTDGWDTSNVTSLLRMFAFCSSLTSLDVSGWDTSKVTNIQSTFYNCPSLTSLDVSGWDTSNVTTLYSAFQDCNALTSLDVSNFNTTNVTDMSNMFYKCSNLTSLDVSKWDTGKVTKMDYMFHGCSKLTQLDVSKWDTSKVTSMNRTFRDCSQLTTIGDVSNWDISRVTNMSSMFNNCSSLTQLDVSNWDINSGTNTNNIFFNCKVKNVGLIYCPKETINTLANCITSPCNFYVTNKTYTSPNSLVKYVMYREDKKLLLYYNDETQTWEKPILRQWDTIEKHADGKYYYHKRSGEVVLDGSEVWIVNSTQPANTELFGFYCRTSDKAYASELISNYFTDSKTGDVECIRSSNVNANLLLSINKSRLSSQDVEGLKAWLQANNVTVVYQLAEEKVYECTNLDLITYEGESNCIVTTGAISPLSTLRVKINIRNVVLELQQKVSNLENYIQHVMIDALNNALNE